MKVIFRFAIADEGGVEVFCYKSVDFVELFMNPQIISGFLNAFQYISEEIGYPIQEIHFSNLILYIKTYGNFTLRLLLEKRVAREKIKGLFEVLSKKTLLILGNGLTGKFVPHRVIFQEKLGNILFWFEQRFLLDQVDSAEPPDEIKLSTFHSSCDEAMIKPLFLSLPRLIINRLLEEEVVDYFEEKILAEISRIPQSQIGTDTFRLDRNLYQKMFQAGHFCSLSLQKSWMEYLMGEWRPHERLLSSKSVSIVQSGKSLLIVISDWNISNVPRIVINILFSWFLTGVFKIFNLGYPKLVEDDGNQITWKINNSPDLISQEN